MLVGYPPFFSEDRMVLYQNILAGRIEFPRHVSKTARDLISKLLQVNAAEGSVLGDERDDALACGRCLLFRCNNNAACDAAMAGRSVQAAG